MSYSPAEGPNTSLAGLAHLSAIVGPVVPWLIWRAHRDDDPFVAREAAKATNAGMAFLVAFVASTLIELYVPFVGFVGRLGQVTTVAVAVFLCINAYRRVRRGLAGSYPVRLRVVPADA